MKKITLTITIISLGLLMFSCTPGEKKQKTQKKHLITEVKQKLNALTQTEIDEGWVLLFDGKTHNGWRGYGNENFPENGWLVENGTLHVTGSGKGEAGGGGDIITEKKYGNFELSLEWKVSEGGNSGIFYLAQEKPGQQIWKSAPEMQILDNDKHPDARLGINGNRAAGSLYDLIPG
ncbi:MAG: DUF1080 domain-containing protein, partial [Bacteroidales bacterium]|nr:DUF1080 domain-containing protein [Bacteroidales bacterium]